MFGSDTQNHMELREILRRERYGKEDGLFLFFHSIEQC